MPSTRHPTIWPAKGHTLAKIAMLRAYLDAYFPILGTSKFGRDILYVDGFAGPGEYTNAPDGSPVAAIRAATHARRTHAGRWKANKFRCAFIEQKPRRAENLRKRLAREESDPRNEAIVLRADFADGIEQLRQAYPRHFERDDPLFVFIDPFGAKGVPFETVASILRSPCSEVLINLDADGISRIHQAGVNARRDELLDTVYGDRSWQEHLTAHDFGSLCEQALTLYMKKLRALPRVRYVYSFEVRGDDDSLNYHLVFASQAPLGLEKMKEAMKRMDQDGSYRFSGGAVGQHALFRFDRPEDHAPILHEKFLGRTVPYHNLRDYVLNETPFINPIAMLKVLDKERLIDVERVDPTKRGFSGDAVRSVKFLAGNPTMLKAQRSFVENLFGGN